MRDITLGDDILDSRDIIERIAALEADEERDEDDNEELAHWVEFQAQGEGFADWQYGEAFILDSYFTEYAQDLAEDIGAVSSDARRPLGYIDWEAAAQALQTDYSAIEVAGFTYWARS